MAKELKWSKQVEQIVHKANKVLGLLKYTVDGRNFFFKFCTKLWFVQSIRLPGVVTTDTYPKPTMKSRRYKEGLGESPYTKEDRRWRMRRGV